MKKRIFLSMSLLCTVCLLVLACLFCLIFYNQLSAEIYSELRGRALPFATADTAFAQQEFGRLTFTDMRITLIAADGTVLYDNTTNAANLPNHLDRTEVQQAIANGSSEGSRYSDTVQQEIYYYALRLSDGAILRLAKPNRNIWGIFASALPLVAVTIVAVLAVSYVVANKLTRRIVAPISDINPQAEATAPYDELTPYARTINAQRRRIATQLADINSHNATMQAITNTMNEGIIIADSGANLVMANNSAKKLLHINSNATGQSMLTVLRDVSFLQQLQQAIQGERGELTMNLADGIYRVYFSPLTKNGAVILFLDVTERAHAEKMRREFTANVSHELKTPLTSIYGNAELLTNGMVQPSDLPDFYIKIKNEAARLISLIEDIMLMSYLDEGAAGSEFIEVSLLDTAKAAVRAMAEKARRYQISLQLDGSPCSAYANPTMLQELFTNLLDNAIKYNQKGGSVCLTVGPSGQNAQIIVSDTGIGIPAQAQARIFERFYRVDTSRSRETGGTGLGLAIVKHIVMVHKGEIKLESTPGEGTTITVTLPIAEK